MIEFFSFIIIIVVAAEVLIFKQGKKFQISCFKIKELNEKLDFLKELSYLASSKNSSLKDALDRCSISFLRQKKYTALSLILFKSDNKMEIFRYPESFLENRNEDQLTGLEVYITSQYDNSSKKNTLIIPLEPLKKDYLLNFAAVNSLLGMGYVIFFSKDGQNEAVETKFIDIVSKMLAFLIKAFKFDGLYSKEEQIKAVSTQW